MLRLLEVMLLFITKLAVRPILDVFYFIIIQFYFLISAREVIVKISRRIKED